VDILLATLYRLLTTTPAAAPTLTSTTAGGSYRQGPGPNGLVQWPKLTGELSQCAAVVRSRPLVIGGHRRMVNLPPEELNAETIVLFGKEDKVVPHFIQNTRWAARFGRIGTEGDELQRFNEKGFGPN